MSLLNEPYRPYTWFPALPILFALLLTAFGSAAYRGASGTSLPGSASAPVILPVRIHQLPPLVEFSDQFNAQFQANHANLSSDMPQDGRPILVAAYLLSGAYYPDRVNQLDRLWAGNTQMLLGDTRYASAIDTEHPESEWGYLPVLGSDNPLATPIGSAVAPYREHFRVGYEQYGRVPNGTGAYANPFAAYFNPFGTAVNAQPLADKADANR